MSRRTETFYAVQFTPAVIREAIAKFDEVTKSGRLGVLGDMYRGPGYDFPSEQEAFVNATSLNVARGTTRWEYDDLDEFFAEMATEYEDASLRVGIAHKGYEYDFPAVDAEMYIQVTPYVSTISVSSKNRSHVQSVMSVFLAKAGECAVTQHPDVDVVSPTIFVGHGRSAVWRDLKDHLSDHHGYDVQAYESQSRVGLTIDQVLMQMLDYASFAVLVMTAEDEIADGSMRARENVIHEAGLFQGKLGFNRALVLLEEGVEPFSNMAGVQYVKFPKGTIAGTFGPVLAALRREFNLSH